MLLTWAGVLDVECRYCCSVSMPISVAQHIRYEVDRRSPGMSQAVGINTPKHVPVQGGRDNNFNVGHHDQPTAVWHAAKDRLTVVRSDVLS